MSKIFLFFIILYFIFIGIITSDKDFNLINYDDKNLNISDYISSDIVLKNGKKEFIINKTLISIYSKEELFYGDYLNLICDDFSIPKKYLQVKGVKYVCNKPKILNIQNNKKQDFYFYLLKVKYFVKNRIDKIYGNPYNGLIFGILFGGNYLDKDLSNLFSKAGISHITAVSGYNISIIISIFSSIFLKLGFNRFKVFYFLLLFLFLFVLFAGATASVIRAAIMGICSLFALQFGRMSSKIFGLFFVGFIMILFNPLLLIYDIGFQLSFLATFGILFLKPMLDNLFVKFGDFLNIKESFNTTVSAFIFTCPIISLNFSSFNLLSVIVNLLVLQYIPFLMLFGFASIFIPKFVPIFAVFIMKYIIFVCDVFS